MDNDHAIWLTVEQAAARLNRASRTIRRMHSDGRLPGRKQGGRLFVDVSDFVTEKSDTPDTATGRELRAENDRLRDLIDRQESEIAFLRSALASALRLQQAAIEAPRRRWRWPWQRDEN